MNLEKYIRDIKDFPKPGIIFKDITPLLKAPQAFNESLNVMEEHLRDCEFDYILGIEARGFIFASALAAKMSKGMIPIRKPGKLPGETHRKDYTLEYGTAGLEIHKDAIDKGDKVIIVDDLLATGGTVEAAALMIKEMGGMVEKMLFLIELDFLNPREKLAGYNIDSIIHY